MTKPLQVDPELKQFATERQKQLIDLINLHGGASAAARAAGVDKAYICRTIRNVKIRAARSGYAPEHDMRRTVPDGFKVKGVSSYYGRDGALRGQWVKSAEDRTRSEELIRSFVESLMEEARGLAVPIPAPDVALADLLAVYAFGDPHFGQRSVAAESGEDFDLSEAERITRAGIDRLAEATPGAETALLLIVGDNTHANDSSHKTPAHRHDLDMDSGGHNRAMLVSAKAWAYAAKRMLTKHQKVVVWFVPGNHDPDAAYALALCLSMYFENEPRIEVDLGSSVFRYLRFGKVLIGSHHGHSTKPQDLPLVMAVDRPADWGATTWRFLYVGHVHHDSVREIQGVRVESLRTLAAKDAYAASHGYRAMRDTRAIIHHKDFGEIERHTVSAAMLTGAA